MFAAVAVTAYAGDVTVYWMALTICDCSVPVKTSERNHS
jgi:hypothetical protein